MRMKATIWVDIDPVEKDNLAEAITVMVTEMKENGWEIPYPVVIVEV